jgi:FMN reductase
MTARTGVLAVVGNPRENSRTTKVAGAVAHRMAADGERVQLVELAPMGSALLDFDDVTGTRLVELLQRARVIVAASPTYKGSYTGLLKLLFDRCDQRTLSGAIALAVMLGAGAAHTLAVELHLRPLLEEVGGTCIGGLYVMEAQLDSLDDVVAGWSERLAIDPAVLHL